MVETSFGFVPVISPSTHPNAVAMYILRRGNNQYPNVDCIVVEDTAWYASNAGE